MDEEVREWLKKKMEKVEAGENVLVEPAPDRSKPVHAMEKPGKEEVTLVEKKIEKEAGVVEETAVKAEPEPEQPVKEQPIKTSVDVGEKIKEHLRERDAGAVEKPEEPKVAQQPQAEQELQPEQEAQAEEETKPEQKQPEQTRPEQEPKSELFKIPRLRLPKISLPKLPAPKRARTASPWMGRLSRRPRFFTKRRILIVIVSSIAGIVAGYLLLQLLSK